MSDLQVKGRKIKMAQVFEPDGTVIPVTIISIDLSDELRNIQENTPVVVSGVSKGKGFAGAVKRYSFAGGPKTHGQSDRHRAVGSIGAGTDPGKVWKGKKMPGRMGGKKVTVKGLRIVRVLPDENLVYISGAVPGGPKSEISITLREVSETE